MNNVDNKLTKDESAGFLIMAETNFINACGAFGLEVKRNVSDFAEGEATAEDEAEFGKFKIKLIDMLISGLDPLQQLNQEPEADSSVESPFNPSGK